MIAFPSFLLLSLLHLCIAGNSHGVGLGQKTFDADQVINALLELKNEIESTESLSNLTHPIRVISLGDYAPLVFHWGNKKIRRIPYLLDPSVEHLRQDINRAIENTANGLGLPVDWMIEDTISLHNNQNVQEFIIESWQQNQILCASYNFEIMAAPWSWHLKENLRNVAAGKHHEDVVTTARYLRLYNLQTPTRGPLNRELAKSWNLSDWPPIDDDVIDLVEKYYTDSYNRKGFTRRLNNMRKSTRFKIRVKALECDEEDNVVPDFERMDEPVEIENIPDPARAGY